MDDSESSNPFLHLGTLASIILIVATLYFAKSFLIPLALALLVSFLLTPVITALERFGFRRIPAVLLVVVLGVGMTGGLAWIVASQVLHLASKLPEYKETLRDKIKSVGTPVGKELHKTTETVEELSKELAAEPEEKSRPARSTVTKVEIVEPPPNPFKLIGGAIQPLLDPLATAGVVVVLVIFVLAKKEDLRDRLVCLTGPRRLRLTRQMLDDAAARVSRYLFMQMIINIVHGLAVGFGTFAIGLPNAALWGVFSALLRFVPYLGPWVAALAPIALSLAVFDGWTRPIVTVGLFVVLELISNNLLEPWLYSTRTGVSSVALIVAAVFWTWLWGSVGLILSAPITVCLAVMGKHIPRLEFLDILLGDEPPEAPKRPVYASETATNV